MIIPLLLAPDDPDAATWLAALAAALPTDTVQLFHHCTTQQRQHAQFAVGTNALPQALPALPQLQWLHSVWAGVDVLLPAAAAQGVHLVRLVDPELTRTMSEAVLTWVLYLHRHGPEYALQQRDHHWQALPYVAARYCHVGVLGLGELGAAAASRLAANDFRVSGWSRQPRNLPGIHCVTGNLALPALLQRCDIVVCLLPLNASTTGLLDHTMLGQLAPHAALLNFGRAAIVPSADLLARLDDGHLRHAVLDVFDTEPLPATDRLWQHPRITVLPHDAGPSTATSSAAIVAANLTRWRATGELPPGVGR